jgi:hypothetical protein
MFVRPDVLKETIMKTHLTAILSLSAGLLCACGSMYGDLADTLDENAAMKKVWRSEAPMPTARHNSFTAEANGKIYVMGGWKTADSVGCSDDVDAYDLRTGKWAVLRPNSDAALWMGKRVSAACCAIDGKIYVAGGLGSLDGSDSYSQLQSLRIYTPETNTWTDGDNLPADILDKFCSVTSLSGKMFLVSSNLQGIYVYSPGAAAPWSLFPGSSNTVVWRANPKMAAVGSRIFITDKAQDGSERSVYVLDPSKETLTRISSPDTVRSGAQIAVVNGKICLIGGYDTNSQILRSTVILDPASISGENSGIWSAGPDLSVTREFFSVLGFGSGLFIFGGSTGDSGTTYYNDVYSYYDPSL